MKYTCVAAALLPHPPIMLPEIGGTELQKIEKTVTSVTAATEMMAALYPDTVAVISPHNYGWRSYFPGTSHNRESRRFWLS